ncbi:MAG: hypothetical protein VX699_03200 [Myxococcota bacterium]|nr:hypothetical protein [Myxococcota bacterium]
MSVNALKPTLSAIRADGNINLEEIEVLIDPKKGLGVNTDADEFELFRRLATDIKVGNLKNVTPETVKEVNDNNKKRLVHKGVKIGAAVGGVLGVAALIATPILLGPLFFAAPGIAMAVLGLTVGIGALAGFIRSRTTPITKGEIKRQSPLAVAATRFKKNPLVQRGVKIAGAIGGTIGGTGALGALTVGSIVAIAAGTTSLAAPVIAVTAGYIGVLGAGVALLIGIGALGGYIHSKVKGSGDKDIPTGPVTADAEAVALLEKTIDKGVTTKDYVKKGTKIGGIVAGVIGGLGLGGWTAGTIITSAVAGASGGAVAAGIVAGVAGWYFLPVAGVVLAAAALSVGIGALAGFIHSKVKKQKD